MPAKLLDNVFFQSPSDDALQPESKVFGRSMIDNGGPRNLSSIDLGRIAITEVSGKDLKILTGPRALTMLAKVYPRHFDWSKELKVEVECGKLQQTATTLCFAMVVERRESFWRGSTGVTRGFDEIFHSLDKWDIVAPPVVLDNTAMERTVEFNWPRPSAANNLDGNIAVNVPCWEHVSDCLACKGIASIDSCFVCRGKGVFKQGQCNMCSSKGKYYCRVCSNTGKVACLLCNSNDKPGIIELSAIARIQRRTILSEPKPYQMPNTDIIIREARMLLNTFDEHSSVVALTAIVANWESHLVTVSDSTGLIEHYQILGTECKHLGQSKRPELAKRPTFFSKSMNSGIGKLRLTGRT